MAMSPCVWPGCGGASDGQCTGGGVSQASPKANPVRYDLPRGEAAFALQFSALGASSEFGGDGVSAIVFIADGARQIKVDVDLLVKCYGLTTGEARVAVALLECNSAKEVAKHFNTSAHTVRTQIKQIYAKLGVDSRTRFVKLILGLARE